MLSVVDVTFTPMNVLRAVREVKNTIMLGICLGVPDSKRGEFEFSNEAEERKAYINYFIEHDPEASWRRIICLLDWMGLPDTVEAADNIRHLAEAVTGRPGITLAEAVCRREGLTCGMYMYMILCGFKAVDNFICLRVLRKHTSD